MQVTEVSGSVRVDLLGGTIDLEPINLILPNVVTLNVATSLKAKVQIKPIDGDLTVISKDYKKSYSFKAEDLTYENFISNHFEEMSFVLQIIDLFNIKCDCEVTLESGSPAGAGLGGSSAMGVTLYKALCQYTNTSYDPMEAVLKVKSLEGRILNRGVPGYQDYFPALVGGVLKISGKPGGIEFEQLFSKELKEFLEDHLTLVYSGITRNSGINNWEVYKRFFDGDEVVRAGLSEIAKLSFKAYQAILKSDFSTLIECIGLEGQVRDKLFTGIMPNEIKQVFEKVQLFQADAGIKMCGAGGGGCFIIIHPKKSKNEVQLTVEESGMTVLPFIVDQPL